jgi:hypothetical protein
MQRNEILSLHDLEISVCGIEKGSEEHKVIKFSMTGWKKVKTLSLLQPSTSHRRGFER